MRFGHVTAAYLCGLLLVIAATRAPAQTVAPTAAGSLSPTQATVPTLNVALTVYARELASTPQSVTVIDRRLIEDSGARTVGDLLRYAAGNTPPAQRLRSSLIALDTRLARLDRLETLMGRLPLAAPLDYFSISSHRRFARVAGFAASPRRGRQRRLRGWWRPNSDCP